MRVLLCIDSLGVGGKERQAVALARGLSTAPGILCRAVCFDDATFYKTDLPNIHVDVLPRRSRWDLALFRRLRSIITEFQPDVIHSNGIVSSFYSLPLAKRFRIPLINGSIRNAFSDRDLRWRLERYLLLCSDCRVANSRAGLHSRMLSESDPRNVVIYNGFDGDSLRASSVHTAASPLTFEPTTKKVGMVAEFNDYKDYSTFVEAARMVCAARVDVSFLAVGGGANLAKCQSAAQDVERLHFLGERKDVAHVIGFFDIGVLCSFSEGLPNSVMEYMAMAKPVVATDRGGTCELVVNGETGFLVKPHHPEDVASAIVYLLDHPDVASAMGAAGQRRLHSDFSLTQMVENTLALYNRVLQRAAITATA